MYFDNQEHGFRRVLILAALLSLAPASVCAQDSSSTGQQSSGDQSVSSPSRTNTRKGTLPAGRTQPVTLGDVNSDDDVAPPAADTLPGMPTIEPQVREIRSSRWLVPGAHSPLHLGPIYTSTMSLFYLYGDTLQLNTTTGINQLVPNQGAVFQTTIVYDQQFRRNRFSVQYQPELAIVNGRFEDNLSNQNLSANTAFMLSPRWTLSLANTYTSMNGRSLYGDFSLDSSIVTGNATQNPFLQNGFRSKSDEADAILAYQLNARDVITINPSYFYLNSTLSTGPTTSQTFGTSVNWGHVLSATKGFGLYYSWSDKTFSALLPNTRYQSFGPSFYFLLAPTWKVNFSAGVGTTADRGGRQWTANGNATLMKQFRHSMATLIYTRENNFGPFLTNQWSDRIDVAYNVQASQRLNIGIGFAHQSGRTLDALGFNGMQQLAGNYVSLQSAYRISPALAGFVNYGRLWQTGASQNPLANGSNFVSAGIRWDLIHHSNSF